MKPAIKDMTKGSPLSLILTFSLPLMVGNIFQQMYTVVDTIVVGRVLGVDALAALGATDWLYWMVLGMIQGVTQGFGILMAREFGAKQYESLRRVIGNAVSLSALCAAVLLALGQGASEPVLRLLDTPPEIMGDSLTYLRIMLAGIPVVMAYNLLACILRALGDGRSPLNAMVLSACSNVVLDLLFVLVFGWGIAGAASATLIAQLLAGLYCVNRLRNVPFLKLTRKDCIPGPEMAGRLLSLGSPMAMQNAIIAIGGMIIQSTVNDFGVAFIGGFTATNKLYGVLEVAATSYGYAMITYVGQNLGAGEVRRIRKGMGWAVTVALATSLVIGAAMILLGRDIVAAFISGDAQTVAQATDVGYEYLAVMSLCLPVLYILHVTRSAIQGMGNTVLPMVSGIAEFIMRTGGVLLLPGLMGQRGIFLAEVLAWAGADMILIPSYWVCYRKIEK